MIVKEFYRTRKDGINLYRTYSDQGLKIQKVGADEIFYDEAIDIETAKFEYIETDEYINGSEEISGEELKNMLEGVL